MAEGRHRRGTSTLGAALGTSDTVGIDDGIPLGDDDNSLDGTLLGNAFGIAMGTTEGDVLVSKLGSKLGIIDGSLDGAPLRLGRALGLNDGAEHVGKIKFITNVFWI